MEFSARVGYMSVLCRDETRLVDESITVGRSKGVVFQPARSPARGAAAAAGGRLVRSVTEYGHRVTDCESRVTRWHRAV
eukprot:756069-Hanusia_phi.AAC.3